jgi:ABC-type transport system involved in Fe-S cluster assembly fused permease/ATPase subunit
VDSLINFETVKYFNNERWEHDRYDEQMQKWEAAQIKSQISLSWLNLGQSLIIAAGVTLMMWRAAVGVANGSMTVGDIVLVNAFLIQLYMPLNHLGVLYREIRQSLDRHRAHVRPALAQPRDPGRARCATAVCPAGRERHRFCEVEFVDVGFAYEANRQILHEVDFKVGAGRTVAVVGHSGSGKSTLARLLFRFYDARQGSVRINGSDLRQLHPGQPACGDRHRAAGHRAVQRHHLLQHPVRPARANRARRSSPPRQRRSHDFIEAVAGRL